MIDEQYIGALIRNLRITADLTLSQIAEKTGLSKSLLSRIEHGKICPPIPTLSKIADALDVHISTFFREEGVAAVANTAYEAREFVVSQNPDHRYSFADLVGDGYGRKLMNPFIIRVERDTLKPFVNTVPGDQFMLVTEGAMKYKYAGSIYTMNAGDSLYFRGEVPHGVYAVLTPFVEYLMVLSRRFTVVEE